MTFKRLSEYFRQLEENTSRLKITEILADLFKASKEEEIDKICYLSLGRLLPAYQGVEFQMAEKMMQKALAKAFGVELEKVVREMKKAGDLGVVAEQFKVQGSKFKVQSLLEIGRDEPEKEDWKVLEIYERLLEIARESGEGSVERKIDKTALLLRDLDSLSVRYVVRMPLGKMRLGFSEMTILDGLSWMIAKDKSLRKELEDAYNVVADVGEIARRIKRIGSIEGLKGIRPKLGIPILPALAQRLGTVEEMLAKMGGKVAIEPKYDGERLQIHVGEKLGKEGVRIFTRNMENVTHMFPDIVAAVKKEIRAKEVILDSEGVGFDPKTGKFFPFQETMKRKRKHRVEEAVKQIPFRCFVFDVMYKNGESLLKTPFWKRRKILEEILPLDNQTLVLTPQLVTDDPQKMRQFHEEQIKKGLEGAMVKQVEANYEPGRRGFVWVKFKQEETKKGGGLADTIDCVVMGIYRGRGKRVSFGVGAFLVGVLRGENYVTVSKIGTGLTDEQWKELKKRSSECKVKQKPKGYE
ncbi:MAG: ATP-dependent DNA ligase, partial [Microgenomates group bacterium]